MQENNKTLTHHGVKGQRWGVRRYQNADGSLTTAGKKRRAAEDKKEEENSESKFRQGFNKYRSMTGLSAAQRAREQLAKQKESAKEDLEKLKNSKDNLKNKISEMDENRRNNNAKLKDNIKKKLGLDDDEADAKTKSKSKSDTTKKRQQDDVEELDYESAKLKALKSGSAADVMKYQGQLTNQELQSAVSRLNMESQLSSMNQKTVKTGWDKISDIASRATSIANAANSAINVYNVVAKINNSLNPKFNLPSLDGGASKAAAAEAKMEKWLRTATDEDVVSNLSNMSTNQVRAAMQRKIYEDALKKRVPSENNS